MPTPQKAAVLKDTQERIAGVRGLYLADFSGLTVEKMTQLRKQCREQGIAFRVIKNTLLRRSFNERGITELDAHLVGNTGLVYSPTNEMAPAKVLSDFAKENEKLKVKAQDYANGGQQIVAVRKEMLALQSGAAAAESADKIAKLNAEAGRIAREVTLPIAAEIEALAKDAEGRDDPYYNGLVALCLFNVGRKADAQKLLAKLGS